MSVEGAGPATAARLRAALELGRRLGTEVDQDAPVVGSPDDAAAILIPRMQHLEQEHLVVLVLDTRNRLIGEPAEIYRGSLNEAMVRAGGLPRPAIPSNGASITVAHTTSRAATPHRARRTWLSRAQSSRPGSWPMSTYLTTL